MAVFNQENFNYKALRAQLLNRGNVFKSASDTVVLVHEFEEWGGIELVKQLRGQFVFAIYNTRILSLFLLRDHVGVKSLYRWSNGEVFVFGSEIKSILSFPGLASR